MDWRKVERRLLGASTSALERFAKDHPAESFYGFIFDCNEDYGEVFMCLNTEADLAEHAARSNYSQRDVEKWLRWNAGDWKYHGFNTEPPCAEAWEKAWSATQDAIHSAFLDDEDEEEDVPEHFLECVCRVLIAMERDGAFDRLTRDPGFKTLVGGHDEPIEDSWRRLLAIRNAR